ncbi:MAG: PAS domain-containing protein [Phycisphaerae bacterium]|nr:PAS domain-containing protein [Phycisphaerae bacterium]
MIKTNKHFREALLETVPCSVFMVDTNNHIIFWNRSAEELTQYASEEIVGLMGKLFGGNIAKVMGSQVGADEKTILGACRRTQSSFERPFDRLAASACIDDKTNIACFGLFANRSNCSLSGFNDGFSDRLLEGLLKP